MSFLSCVLCGNKVAVNNCSAFGCMSRHVNVSSNIIAVFPLSKD